MTAFREDTGYRQYLRRWLLVDVAQNVRLMEPNMQKTIACFIARASSKGYPQTLLKLLGDAVDHAPCPLALGIAAASFPGRGSRITSQLSLLATISAQIELVFQGSVNFSPMVPFSFQRKGSPREGLTTNCQVGSPLSAAIRVKSFQEVFQQL